MSLIDDNFENELSSESSQNKTVMRNKLLLLYIFDKMEVELSENTILDITSGSNSWINYMECKQTLLELQELGYIFLLPISHGEPLYTITPEGRSCLSCFYMKINKSVREEVDNFIKQKRTHYKKKQQYIADYFKNADGTYTVALKIVEPSRCVLDLKINVDSRNSAKTIFKQWEEKAPNIYSLLYDNLID